jgi:hypothetical protein
MSETTRPVGVTLVGLLVLIGGVFIVAAGILGLVDEDTRIGVSIVTLILMIVLGLIYLAVARGIFTGNNFSRAIVGIVTLISLVIGVIHLIFVSELRISGLVQILFALVILALLYNRRATVYFATH